MKSRRRGGEDFIAQAGKDRPVVLVLPEVITGSRRSSRVAFGKKVVLMDLSRAQYIKLLRHAGLNDVADTAEAELPDPVDSKTLAKFCTAHGVSLSMLTDRMGASP
jgi:hypothetical protein